MGAGLAGTMQSLSYATSYYKPIRTGMNESISDLEFVNKIDANIKLGSCYEFESSASPLIGAYKTDVKKININQIISSFKSTIEMTECHIVEGSNSISTPIDDKNTETTIVKELSIPMVLVVDYEQTTLDEIITGASYIYSNRINCIGVILNEYNDKDISVESKYFSHLIKEYTGLNVLGHYPYYEDFNNIAPEILIADTLNGLNIEEIFGLKIAKLAN